ncbi:MAG: ATP-binding protein [Pirellulaceae bacterium]
MTTFAGFDQDTLQARLEQLEQQLHCRDDAAQRAKSDFLANMSHEMRTPLNAVIGFTRLLTSERLTSQQHEKVRFIGDSAHALLELINDLITLAKYEAGVLRPYLTWFDAAPVLRESIDHCLAVAHLKGLRVEYEYESSIPDVLRGDRARLRQVLVNLLGNAVKFTDEGLVKLRVSVDHETHSQVTLRFEIEDTGPGIDDEMLEHLFQPFTQGDASTTRNYGGTGMGLALCRRLIDLLEGQLGCRRRDEGGSLFWFMMTFDKHELSPRAVVEETTDQSQSAALPGTARHEAPRDVEAGARILIVDDDRLCRVLLSDMLHNFGDCEFAASGVEAIDKVEAALDQQSPFDLICLDIMMPAMDGHTTLEEIRRREEMHGIGGGDCAKVVMTTALRESHHCLHAFKAGCEAYLTKPIEQAGLMRTLRELGVVQQRRV